MKVELLIIACFFCFGCNSNTTVNETKINWGDSNYIIKKEKQYDSMLNVLYVDNLKKKPNNDEIIIWLHAPGLVDSGKIIIFKSINEQWIGEYHKFRFIANGEKFKKLLTQTIVKGHPKSGWESFLEKIEKIGLYKLDDINADDDCSHGESIAVEVAKKGKYMKWYYPCWTSNDENIEIKKVIEIVKLTEAEFGFNIMPIF